MGIIKRISKALGNLLTIRTFCAITHVALNLLLIYYFIIESFVIRWIPVKYRAKDISGQIALVTGAGGGIGRLISLKLAKLGCKVVCCDVVKQANEETARLIKLANGDVHAYHVDLTKREDVYRMADRVKKEVGKVSILINNAGVLLGKNLLECTDDEIQHTFDVNVMSHFWVLKTTKSFLPDMIEQNRGHIVTIASMGGLVGNKRLVAYCASKFATIGFDESLRIELAVDDRHGIATSIICPYFVRTPMTTGVHSRVLPLLEPDVVAQRSIDCLLTNKPVCMIPRYLNLFMVLKSVLPVKAILVLERMLGISSAMDTF